MSGKGKRTLLPVSYTHLFDVQGEIVARGYNSMKGYYNRPEATRQAVDEDGWLHTGDIGTMDENGYFKINGLSLIHL